MDRFDLELFEQLVADYRNRPMREKPIKRDQKSVQTVDEVGFRVPELKRRVIPIDVGFYERFEDELGRYPALDLETDFATLVLEKESTGRLRRGWDRPLPELGYLERQRALDEAIAAEPAAGP